MSKRFLAIYDDKNNTYLNNCFSTNNLEMIKKFDTLNIECSIVEINKELFKFFLKLLTQFPMANIGIKYNIVTISHPIKDGSSR